MRTNPIRLGVIFGLFLALFHTFWAALVALSWAQLLIDFVFWAHFITPAWRIEPFAWERAGVLVGFTFLVGLVMGTTGGWLWNRSVTID
ncbi:MAG TPA: hypothetical protein VL381_07315 [Rhodocyclaceae bacterium]|nr:hypothetical protein [Rhodocyclaceae bacterium]